MRTRYTVVEHGLDAPTNVGNDSHWVGLLVFPYPPAVLPFPFGLIDDHTIPRSAGHRIVRPM